MKFPSRERIAALRQKYLKGTLVELISMEDAQAPPLGTLGEVQGVDDAGQILVRWRTGSSLNLLPSIDSFRIVQSGEVRSLLKNPQVYTSIRLLYVSFRGIYVHEKRKQGKQRKGISKMKAATARQIENMKKQTIGVEVEMYGISRRDAAAIAADFFGTGDFKDTARRNGYCTWSAWDDQGREWKFQRDVSIEAASSAEQTELVTPILHYEDIEYLQELLRRLRHAGAKSNPAHMCGVHIHIGKGEHTAKTLRNLANLMASHESLLIAAMRIDQSRLGRYCRTVNRTFLDRLNKEKPQTMEKLADIWYEGNSAREGREHHYNGSRYHCLNLHATFTKGTIEFRLFQFADPTAERKGGLHAGELKSYIQLCLALSEAAKSLKTASPKEPQRENPKFAMRTWLMRLGFIGWEFTTARDILTRNLAGDAAFRFGRSTPSA